MSSATAWADAVRALALFANDPLGLAGVAVRAAAGPVRDHFLMLLRDCRHRQCGCIACLLIPEMTGCLAASTWR